ncbi:putative nucleic-acid-binding protein containing a Zn-ribbon [Caldisphaera lagunensis DSM 15908]|uniref:Putative nucleic-acid-binding protein containing a Zn-ribbon n=1 Tax=Caldisphaera lagunensis (strain DSM 15908 / JCM 11604 / ANMR 0165 / IC-154) TaxID=1056495 RepID=L0A8R3_CALLD|nr:Zn-ribbon domain-containing OB-fold protein [Caldisphaera lagunensis]AFZ70263.1 putative nucleic-acid-binding protein containing a Zn-ribbon [Caldisphaera lagunensis DSM 15908]
MSMDLSISRFWRKKEILYKLNGAKCKSCGKVHYPPKNACPYCGSRELEYIELPRKGKLISYTTIYAIPDGARPQSPIYFGLIDLGIAKITAELTDIIDPSILKKDMEVEATLRKTQEDRDAGLIYYVLKFRPSLVHK